MQKYRNFWSHIYTTPHNTDASTYILFVDQIKKKQNSGIFRIKHEFRIIFFSTSNTPWATVYDEPIKEDTPLTPTVVIYIVDPFHNCPNNQSMLWSFFGLLKCFLEMCSSVTGKLKENVLLQVIQLAFTCSKSIVKTPEQ